MRVPKFLLPAPKNWISGPKTAKFGPKLAFWAKYRHFWPIWSNAWPKNDADKLSRWFSVMLAPELLLTPLKIRICDPKTAKFDLFPYQHHLVRPLHISGKCTLGESLDKVRTRISQQSTIQLSNIRPLDSQQDFFEQSTRFLSSVKNISQDNQKYRGRWGVTNRRLCLVKIHHLI